jgi:hypothetical protein
MVKSLLTYVVFAVAGSGCVSGYRAADAERAKRLALTYLADHHVRLPHRYTLTAQLHDYVPESGHAYPVYDVCLWPPRQWKYGSLYCVNVNPRSWGIEVVGDIGGLRLADEYFRAHKDR